MVFQPNYDDDDRQKQFIFYQNVALIQTAKPNQIFRRINKTDVYNQREALTGNHDVTACAKRNRLSRRRLGSGQDYQCQTEKKNK